VRSGTLIVAERNSDPTFHLGDDSPTVTVSTPSLVGARTDGSGNLSLAGLDGGPLQVHVDGSGDLDAHGRLDTLDAGVDGSGDLDLNDLLVQSATVDVSGSGDADVHVVHQLGIVLSGSGDVDYAGDPEVRRNVSGSGGVSRR
jgi:hypothetical protein